MRPFAAVTFAGLLGCNAVLGLDDRAHSPASGLDASADVDVPLDGDADGRGPTWCESEPPHTYCEDFDRDHVLGLVQDGTGTAIVEAVARTAPMGLTCSVGTTLLTSSSATLPIPVSASSKTPSLAFDFMLEALATKGDVDVELVSLLMLTTSFRLVYAPTATGKSGQLTLLLGEGTGSRSVGVGGFSEGWHHVSMSIEVEGGTPMLVVLVDGLRRAATDASFLADSDGIFQIQQLIVGADGQSANRATIKAHYDDVTLDL